MLTPAGSDRGHARLHGARAGDGAGDRSVDGPLPDRRRGVRAAGRAGAVRPPDGSPIAVMMQHINDPVPPLPAGTDPALEAWVLRMVAKDPADRPSGARGGVRRARGDHPRRRRPAVAPRRPAAPSPTPRPRRPSRSRRPTSLPGTSSSRGKGRRPRPIPPGDGAADPGGTGRPGRPRATGHAAAGGGRRRRVRRPPPVEAAPPPRVETPPPVEAVPPPRSSSPPDSPPPQTASRRNRP